LTPPPFLAMCVRPLLVPAAALLLWRLCPSAAASAAAAEDSSGLAADDECSAGAGCGLSALQRRGSLLEDQPSAAGRLHEAASSQDPGCHDAVPGDACYSDIQWAKRQGILQHPGWYHGMTAASPDTDFQWAVHAADPKKCPQPCSGAPPTPAPPVMPTPPPDPKACLCVFDIDRTLTAKQGSAATGGACPAGQLVPGVEDDAYGGGELVLSQVAQGLRKTFCRACYIGVCSHGDADFGYSKERGVLLKSILQTRPMRHLRLRPFAAQWSDEGLLSPYVVMAPDEEKQLYVAKIREWYLRQGIGIMTQNVFFFDDRANNVLPFKGTGLNARQISCASRDMTIAGGAVGLCGATLDEIVRQPGVVACPGFDNSTQLATAKGEEENPSSTKVAAESSQRDIVADRGDEVPEDIETKAATEINSASGRAQKEEAAASAYAEVNIVGDRGDHTYDTLEAKAEREEAHTPDA